MIVECCAELQMCESANVQMCKCANCLLVKVLSNKKLSDNRRAFYYLHI